MTSPTSKIKIASELLNSALRLYYEGDSNFSALHLAGAAEEIFAKHVEAKGGETSFTNLRDGAVRISKYLSEDQKETSPATIAAIMNHAKNATKHMGAENDYFVVFDARSAARDLLDRAVSNYFQAMLDYELEESELIRRFNIELASGA
jgi:hypothetical protein